MRELAALVCGVVFGAGLLVSGMTNPAKVLGFLDLAGRWDPTLAFVMGGALAVNAAAWALTRRREAPLFAAAFALPAERRIDRRLLAGAALFGVGWGLCGVCPGPAIAGLGVGNWPLLIALAGLILGAYIQGRFFGSK